MKANIINLDNEVVGEAALDPSVFGVSVRSDILHRVVIWQLAKRRAGTHKAKQIGDVRGSTRKIYAQKGTGRARHGSLRAAQFRGGGIIFGPVVRSHAFSLNKRVRALGLKMALSHKMGEDSLLVVDSWGALDPKTASFRKVMSKLGCERSCLVVDSRVDDNLSLATSNLKYFNVLPVGGLNVLDVLKHKNLILSTASINDIKARLVDAD